MPSFNVVVEHHLPRTEAIERLRGFSEKIREQSPVELTDVEENWDADGNLQFGFKAMGFAISGSVKTDDENVTVGGSLPFAAAMFRGAIETQIADQVKTALSD